jgi:hypothetical protein
MRSAELPETRSKSKAKRIFFKSISKVPRRQFFPNCI